MYGPSVQSLIDTTDKTWNWDVVNQTFSPEVANSILNTPLVGQVTEDGLIWKIEKNSYYSVKSAYRLCVEVLTDSSHLRREGFWKGIWRLNVPPKVKNLIWRSCRDVMPTRKRLQDKGVLCPGTCVTCNDAEEDLAHVYFNCPFSMQVWQRMGFWGSISRANVDTGSVPECIFTLLQSYTVENCQRFTATLWSLWKRRNLQLWQDVSETVAQVIDRAFHLVEDWCTANSIRDPPQGISTADPNMITIAPTALTWQHPQQGRLKCNIDASFSESLNRTGIGVCIRDAVGTFVLAKTLHFSPKCSVPLGEAMGLYYAVQWLCDMSFDSIDFALDSKIVTDAFHHQRPDIS
ncbi:hypothetical protein QL285_095501 [Trifolium repens]|nr:hypothetical protein QL285_095501 [Trifolium repens]